MAEKIFEYTLSGQIFAPEGSKLNETHTGIILPDGKEIKVWEQLEICTVGKDDHRNLRMEELEGLGLWFDGDPADVDEAME